MDKFWSRGRRKGRLALKNILKFEVVMPLDFNLEQFKGILEECEDVESVTLLLACVDKMTGILKDKRFILKELKRALDYEREAFRGEGADLIKDEEGSNE